MTVVDTSVWVDYLADRSNPQTDWLEEHFSSTLLGLPDLVLCEVLQGIRTEASFVSTKQALINSTTAIAVTRDLYVEAAQNYRWFRERGVTIRSTIDCVVATLCLEAGYALLHRDRDFDHFEQELGLKVVRV